MEKTKKPTKRETITLIKELLANNAQVVAYCDHELELLARKSSSSAPTAKQVENEAIKNTIVALLADIAKPVTISELQAQYPELANYSNQKLTSLFTQLKDEKRVVRTTDKKKAYFSIEN